MIERIGALGHCLQAAGAVDMGDCGDQRPFFGADLEHLHHEGDVVVLFEPFGDGFVEDRGRKGPKQLCAA